MAKPTIVFGLLLILLGLVGYFGTPKAPATTEGAKSEAAAAETEPDKAEKSDDGEAPAASGGRSITALIPAFVGIVLLACGVLALNEKNVKHAMHAAASVGLLGAIAGVGRGGMGLAKLASGTEVNTRSLLFVWLMAILCGAFVGMCVKSFIDAKKRRLAAESGGDGA